MILFIDDRPEEIALLCELADLDRDEVTILCFHNTAQVIATVAAIGPSLVLVGHGLSQPENGDDVVRALRGAGFTGLIFGNSGGGAAQWQSPPDGHVDRRPEHLKEALARA